MNENLKMGPQGLRLLMDFEKGDDSVPLSEGGAALAPYVCPGDELTIGYGCTHWFDGEPVQIHHRLEGESDALQLLMHNLTPYEDCVRGALTREATQNQFDGMVCLCFNIGRGAFLDSSVLKSFNAGRMEDAAANFGLWTGSTTARPRKKQVENPEYALKLKQNHKGIWCWIGPEGQYCSYMLRLGGLLYRHYAEALLFMSRDWTRTLRSSTAMELALEPTLPADAEWDAGKGRWIDKVRYRTPFKDVYAKAYDDRLEAPAIPAPMEPAGAKPSPAASPDSAKPTSELVLTKDMQAAREASPVAAGGTSPATQPVSVPSATVSNSASAAESRPAPGSVAPQPSPSGAGASTIPAPKPPLPTIPGPMPPMPPAGTKPISPNTKMPEHVPYRIDPTAGLKPMEETERFVGAALMLFGTFARVILAQGTAVTGIGGIFIVAVLDMMKSPTNLAILVTVITMGITAVLWVIAFIVDKLGLRIKKRGERTSTQAMY